MRECRQRGQTVRATYGTPSLVYTTGEVIRPAVFDQTSAPKTGYVPYADKEGFILNRLADYLKVTPSTGNRILTEDKASTTHVAHILCFIAFDSR